MSRRAIPLSRKWNCWSSRSRLYFLLFSFLFQSFITYDSFFFLFVSLLLGAVVLPSVRWSKRFHPLENGTAGQAGRGFTFFFFCKSFITYNSFLVSLLLGVVVLPSIRRGQWLHAFQNGATRQAGRGGPSLLGPYDCGLYRDCTFFLYFLHVFIFLGAVVLPSICRSKRLHSLENGIAGETSRGGPSLLGPDDCGLYRDSFFFFFFFFVLFTCVYIFRRCRAALHMSKQAIPRFPKWGCSSNRSRRSVPTRSVRLWALLSTFVSLSFF